MRFEIHSIFKKFQEKNDKYKTTWRVVRVSVNSTVNKKYKLFFRKIRKYNRYILSFLSTIKWEGTTKLSTIPFYTETDQKKENKERAIYAI